MAVHSVKELPAGYEQILTVDLQKDKKKALLINGMALAVAAVMVAAALPLVPFNSLYDISRGLSAYLLRFVVLLAGMALYIVLHEAVHGVCMKHFSRVKPRYGFTGLYAYAGSDAYFDKKSYIIIALAPIVVWGVVLAVLSALVTESWFWVVYIIQISNISGAAGDLYVTWKFRSLPEDILVRDTGVSMTVYSAQNEIKA